MFVASEAEGGMYSEKLVQDTFCRSVRTGLREDRIRAHMKPFLDKPGTPIGDEILMRELNVASSEREETTSKQRTTAIKRVNVNEVATEDVDVVKGIAAAIKPLIEGMGRLNNQVQELQNESKNRRQGQQRYTSTRRYGCTKCIADNVYRCVHCFRCGGADHQARECSENARRL